MDANFGFLARHLLLTELHGTAMEIAGGFEVAVDGSTWLGLWDASAVANVETLILEAQKRATAAGSQFAGAVCLSQPGQSAQWNELADALYVYGLPETSGPDDVMVLANPPHPKPRGLRFLPVSESPGAFEIACGSVETVSELTGPAWPEAQRTCELLDVHIAWHDSTIVGAIGTYSTELATRAALLWIEAQWRDREVAQALVEHATQQAQAGGKLLICAWAKKQGLLRFALAEAGFQEQVTARFFKA